MSEENKVQNIDQPDNSTPEENGGQGEKTFTQEEVNRIISERLARERAKNEPQENKDAEADRKLKEVAEREFMLDRETYLREKGYPADFACILKGNSMPEFKDSLNIALTAIRKMRESPSTGNPPQATPESLLRRAFGLNRKD